MGMGYRCPNQVHFRSYHAFYAMFGYASFAIVGELLALVTVETIFSITSWISFAITDAVELTGTVVLREIAREIILGMDHFG